MIRVLKQGMVYAPEKLGVRDILVVDGKSHKEKELEKDLYDYMRVEEIKELSEAAGLERIKLITPDGPANYLRPVLNQMDEEEFDFFIKYHLATCERQELIGAAAHTVDILRKES